MLRIRFQRAGRRNRPFYRIVVAEHSAPIKGKFVEIVGHYNPLGEQKVLEFKQDRVEYWVSVGAQPTQTVARLLAKNGVKGIEKFIEERVTKPTRAEREAAEKAKAAAAEAAAPAAEEAPAEDTPAEEASTESASEEKPTEEKASEEPKEETSQEDTNTEEAKEELAPEENAEDAKEEENTEK